MADGQHGGYRRPSKPAPVSNPGRESARTDRGPRQMDDVAVSTTERIVSCRECGAATRPRKCGTHRCGPCESLRVQKWAQTATDSGLPRACRDCGLTKEPEDFHRKTSAGRRDTRCKECRKAWRRVSASEQEYRAVRAARERERYATDPEYRAFRKAAERARVYGVTPEWFVAKLAEQGGRCAICRTDEPGNGRGWHVDHDHACCDRVGSCGRCVRALLCAGCNVGLGAFRDNEQALRAAADYLEAHRG